MWWQQAENAYSPERRSFPATFRLPLGRLWSGLHQEQVRLPGLRQLAAGGPAQPPQVTAAQRNSPHLTVVRSPPSFSHATQGGVWRNVCPRTSLKMKFTWSKAAEELRKRRCGNKKQTETPSLRRRRRAAFRCALCCTTTGGRRTGTGDHLFVSPQALQLPDVSGGEDAQPVQPDSAAAFVCFCRRFSSVSSVSGVTEQEILKVK